MDIDNAWRLLYFGGIALILYLDNEWKYCRRCGCVGGVYWLQLGKKSWRRKENKVFAFSFWRGCSECTH